ncbi:MAG: ferredoxin-thioredoxin reductase catalytic domain-containing protein [Nanoarchaeota archaeon]
MKIEIENREIDETYEKLKADVETKGYLLNPDIDFTKNLIKGLLINGKRYGYWACPCRLAFGVRERDLDIICPCDYRDEDLIEFGCCYCSLYVSEENFKNKTYKAIPERRVKTSSSNKSDENSRFAAEAVNEKEKFKDDEILEDNMEKIMERKNKTPVWRCKVCGYLCAREHPPEKCPICGVDADRFERFE